eukprot:588303-Prorocentrum_lima.AAC.1
MLLGGDILHHAATLEACGIEDGQTLHLILRCGATDAAVTPPREDGEPGSLGMLEQAPVQPSAVAPLLGGALLADRPVAPFCA